MSSKKNISAKYKEEFIELRMKHDSVSQAIRLAKSYSLGDKDIQPLILMKQELAEELRKGVQKIIKSMNLSDNIIHIQGRWYGVRYINDKGETSLKLDILNETDLGFLRRDCRTEQELSQATVHSLIPSCIDEVELETYKQMLQVRARAVLYDETGFVVEDTDSTPVKKGSCTVSSHAGMRWVQRMMGIGRHNEAVAEEYRRNNIKEIEERVREGHAKSEDIWFNDAEGITFKLDDENIIYVVGNNNIITLYEADFGFTKEINRMILLSQLGVLEHAYKNMLGVMSEQVEDNDGAERELAGIDSEVKVHEAMIQSLKARKSQMVAERELVSKGVAVSVANYEKEFNKLFKKWKQ